MTTTTAAPIRATYSPRKYRRRMRMRTLLIACMACIITTATGCICIAMIMGTIHAFSAPESTPRHITPCSNELFDDCYVDTSRVDLR